MFVDSDFSLLKQNQQGDMVDFKALFGEQDRCDGEFTLRSITSRSNKLFSVTLMYLMNSLWF